MANAKILFNGNLPPILNASQGTVITLSNQNNTGVSSWLWQIADKPTGSVASLSSSSTPTATITLDVEGTYLIKLTVNGGESTNTATAAIPTLLTGIRLPAAGEKAESDPVRGWTPALNSALQSLESSAHTGTIIACVADSTIAVGKTVRITGEATLGNGKKVPRVDVSLATAASNMPCVGVAVSAGTSGSMLMVRTFGGLTEINVDTSTAASLGLPVYVSNSGGMSLTPGTVAQVVGFVESIGASGRVFVRPIIPDPVLFGAYQAADAQVIADYQVDDAVVLQRAKEYTDDAFADFANIPGDLSINVGNNINGKDGATLTPRIKIHATSTEINGVGDTADTEVTIATPSVKSDGDVLRIQNGDTLVSVKHDGQTTIGTLNGPWDLNGKLTVHSTDPVGYGGAIQGRATVVDPPVGDVAVGIYGEAQFLGDGTYQQISGGDFEAYASGANGGGQLENAFGVSVYAQADSDVTVQDLHAVHVFSGWNDGATVDRNAGLFIENQEGVGTKNYAIFYDGTVPFTVGANSKVGIGYDADIATSMLTVSGVVESTTGGFKFPDGSVQLQAALGVNTGDVVLDPTNSNGLVIDDQTLGLDLATASSNGAMSSTDKLAIASLPTTYVAKAGDTMTGPLVVGAALTAKGLFSDGLDTPVNGDHQVVSGSLEEGDYYYRVSAFTAVGETLASAETSVYVDACATPVNDTFTLTSGELETGDYYYRVSALNSRGETLASTETSIAVVSIDPPVAQPHTFDAGTLSSGFYSYKVTGLNSRGESLPSDPIVVLLERPTTPDNVSLLQAPGTLPPGTYAYQVSSVNDFGETLASDEVTITTTDCVTPSNIVLTEDVGTLPPGTYYYRVSAVNLSGETLASAAESIITVADPAGVLVEWDAVPNATAYRIYGRTSGTEELIGETLDGTTTSFLDDGTITPDGALPLSNTTGLTGVTVQWINEAGATSYNIYGRTEGLEELIASTPDGVTNFFTDDGTITPDGDLPVADTTGMGININWDAIPTATSYKIYGRTSGAEELLGTTPDGVTTTFLDDGTITPSGTLPTENTTTAGVNVNWLEVTNAIGYNIYGREAGAELFLGTVSGGSTTTFLDDGSITPDGDLPAANTTLGGVEVHWDLVIGAEGYKVFGRDSGAELLIATISDGDTGIYTDNGSITPSGALPTVNTTGGVKFPDDTIQLSAGVVRVAVPSTATSAGVAGTVAWDANYFYVCTATNTWVRTALATW